MVKITSAEAQNQFGKLIDTAQREPVEITRHGRTAAFVVSPQDMEEILIERDPFHGEWNYTILPRLG